MDKGSWRERFAKWRWAKAAGKEGIGPRAKSKRKVKIAMGDGQSARDKGHGPRAKGIREKTKGKGERRKRKNEKGKRERRKAKGERS